MSRARELAEERGVQSLARRIAANAAAGLALVVRPRRTSIRFLSGAAGVAIAAIAAVVAILAVMIFVDAAAIEYRRRLPEWVVGAFRAITDFGKSGWILWPTGLLLVALALVSSSALGRVGQLVLTSLAVRVGFVFLAVGLSGLVVTIAKRLIGRARPMHFDGLGVFEFAPFSWRVDFASLPSGHGTTVFAAAIAIGALFPRARAAMFVFAATIALSRVAVGAHYPSDVVAGAIVGTLGALFVRHWFAARRLGFALHADGSIRALPGPSLHRIKKIAGRLAAQ